MKTEKRWSIIMMLVFMLGITYAVSSCSTDEDETQIVNNEAKKFVSKWKDERSGWIWTYTLRADGTCRSQYVSKNKDYSWLDSIEEGQWSYGLNILTIIPDNGMNKHTWLVTEITGNRITVVEDGESTILVRVVD